MNALVFGAGKSGSAAAELPLDAVFAVGEAMVAACAAVAGRPPYRVADVPSARAALATFLRPGDAVLLKASHGMHLEAILA